MKNLLHGFSAGVLTFLAPAETGMNPAIVAPQIETIPPDASILETQKGHLLRPEKFVLQVIMADEQTPDTHRNPLPILKTIGFGYPPHRINQPNRFSNGNGKRSYQGHFLSKTGRKGR